MNKPDFSDARIVDVDFGKDVVIVRPVNLYGCKLGDGVAIGPFVEVQQNVRIGAHTRVQSHAFVCEMVDIGEDCFIGHGVMFVNDAFKSGRPAGGDQSKWRATRLGDRVSIGSNSTLLPVNICSDSVVGAGSVVTQDIIEPGIYAGNPARLIRRLEV